MIEERIESLENWVDVLQGNIARLVGVEFDPMASEAWKIGWKMTDDQLAKTHKKEEK